MPSALFPLAVTPSTLTRVLKRKLTPMRYPPTEPFLTVMTSRLLPLSVMAALLPLQMVLAIECPCRSMVILSAATTRQLPQLVRSAVSLYVVLPMLSVWHELMFTAPAARAWWTPARAVTRARAIVATRRMIRWCMAGSSPERARSGKRGRVRLPARHPLDHPLSIDEPWKDRRLAGPAPSVNWTLVDRTARIRRTGPAAGAGEALGFARPSSAPRRQRGFGRRVLRPAGRSRIVAKPARVGVAGEA